MLCEQSLWEALLPFQMMTPSWKRNTPRMTPTCSKTGPSRTGHSSSVLALSPTAYLPSQSCSLRYACFSTENCMNCDVAVLCGCQLLEILEACMVCHAFATAVTVSRSRSGTLARDTGGLVWSACCQTALGSSPTPPPFPPGSAEPCHSCSCCR